MNTTFILSGGAGRVICAIPALEKFAINNPDNDFKIIVHGWDFLFWGNPILQHRTFGMGHKGMFDQLIKDNKIVSPEPYHLWNYYNQKKSLIECFDEEINNTNDHSDLLPPRLFTKKSERNFINGIFTKARLEKSKNKVIVFQPYGSTMNIVGGRSVDPTNRSLDPDHALYIAQELSKHAVVVYFGDEPFIHPQDNVMLNLHPMKPDLRMFMTAIQMSDYFIGCDSVGQHIARSFNKPGTVIMGSTFEKNVSYPEHFKFFRNDVEPVYNPIRIGGIDCDLSDILNEGVMDFTKDELDTLIKQITSEIAPPKSIKTSQVSRPINKFVKVTSDKKDESVC
jgi:hypothetical protein